VAGNRRGGCQRQGGRSLRHIVQGRAREDACVGSNGTSADSRIDS
jgi:hypothetical protein